VRFQFMNSALVLDKRVSLTYTHSTTLAPPPPPPAAAPPSRTALDCSVTFDPANKLNLSHSLGSGGCRLKYTYAHGPDRLTTIEPLFDTNKNAWEFAVSRKFQGGDAIKGTYHASTKLLGLEWTRDSKAGASFKVCFLLLICFRHAASSPCPMFNLFPAAPPWILNPAVQGLRTITKCIVVC
jgi:hypothetical protein